MTKVSQSAQAPVLKSWLVDQENFRQLLSETGQAALQEAMELQPREQDFLRLFTQLKRSFPESIARVALEIAILRREAESKFPAAKAMYFTREALEQATSFHISSYRATRFRGFPYLVDLGCSIGGDTLALAAQAPTLGIDRDDLRLAMARENLHSVGLGDQAQFVQVDLSAELPVKPIGSVGLFFDPARRMMGHRVHSIHAYQPPLTIVNAWLPHFPALAVKVSPAVDLAELNNFDAEVEFISLQGELKEAVLWFGPLKTTIRRATVLPGPHSLFSDDRFSLDGISKGFVLDEPRTYLYEPDPAVLRAGLVQDLGRMLDAAQLDPDIAYLTSDKLVNSPFARCWHIETWFPFQLKRLREALRQREVGQVTIKKRGSPLEPETLIRALRLKGDQQRIVFLTHLRGNPVVILAYPPEQKNLSQPGLDP